MSPGRGSRIRPAGPGTACLVGDDETVTASIKSNAFKTNTGNVAGAELGRFDASYWPWRNGGPAESQRRRGTLMLWTASKPGTRRGWRSRKTGAQSEASKAAKRATHALE